MSLNVVFLGDIVAKDGRYIVKKKIDSIKKELKVDLIIANVDNLSGGFGAVPKHIAELEQIGIDIFTGGDHIWDKKEIFASLNNKENLIRAINYPESLPGKGYCTININGKSVLIIHIMGQVFMKHHVQDPFNAMENILKKFILTKNIDAIIVDFHAEATAEKVAMGHFLDGRVSLVIGTHTHIPTADCCILEKGTGYQTDAGMCGNYNSVIGVEKNNSIDNFLTKIHMKRFIHSNISDNPTNIGENYKYIKLQGVFAKINSKGLIEQIYPLSLLDY